MAAAMVAAGSWALAMVSPYQTLLPDLLTSKVPNMSTELRHNLSRNASILLPGSKEFDEATVRWNRYKQPHFSIAIEVATEHDIQAAIEYANDHSLPFLAVGGGHGATNALSSVHNGLAILTRKLNHVNIEEGGQMATIGSGTLSKEVTDALWSVGKETVTGFCECTGMIGPMLGGGHGLNEGKYGLLADQLVEARMVLANGSLITVSDDSHPDLFWAIRGAGHNFGIVTEFKYKIYDVPEDKPWTFQSYLFTADKVEALYETINDLAEKDLEQADFSYFIHFLRMPQVDPDNAVMLLFFMFEGQPNRAEEYQTAYQAVGPINVDSKEVTYPDIPALMYLSRDDICCIRNKFSVQRAPIGLDKYNIQAQRAVFDSFNNLTSIPAFASALFLNEGFAVKAVKDVPADSTAFPDRHNDLLLSPMIIYEEDQSLDAQALEAAHEMRRILQAGSGSEQSTTYVNYADGTETKEEIYGFEPWRLERLRALKRAYDPQERFSFYAPI